MDLTKQMRKWQQDLASSSSPSDTSGATSSEEALNAIRETCRGTSVTVEARDSVRDTVRALSTADTDSVWQKAIAMTPLHWSGVVFVSTAVLLLIFQPFFVQTSSKDRPYEAPTVSYITVFILAALAALGHQLSLGGD
jgi:Na+/proline symporter